MWKAAKTYALLPAILTVQARRIRKRLTELTKQKVAVTSYATPNSTRPFRRGRLNKHGVAGLNPLVDYRGDHDLFGYKLKSIKERSVVDELASAAELVMGQGREISQLPSLEA